MGGRCLGILGGRTEEAPMTYTRLVPRGASAAGGPRGNASATAPMPPMGRNGAPAYSRTSYRAALRGAQAISPSRRARRWAVALVAARRGWAGAPSARSRPSLTAGRPLAQARRTPRRHAHRGAWRASEVPALWRDPPGRRPSAAATRSGSDRLQPHVPGRPACNSAHGQKRPLPRRRRRAVERIGCRLLGRHGLGLHDRGRRPAGAYHRRAARRRAIGAPRALVAAAGP